MLFILDNDYKNETDVIKLTHTLWDDWFTFETEYIVEYIDQDHQSKRIGTIKIAHDGMSRIPDLPPRFENLSNTYYSLGTDSMYYETLLNFFQTDIKRITILKALRDVAFDMTIFDRVRNHTPFRLSLSRDLSIHQITKQFHRLANGDSEKTSYRFLYKYAKNDLTRDIVFNVNDKSTLLPSNVHAIIGRNGVGKSTLIGRFLKNLSNNNSNIIKIYEGNFEFEGKIDSFFNKIISINFSIFDTKPEIEENFNSNEGLPYIQITKDATLEDFYKKKYGKDYLEKYQGILSELNFHNEKNELVELDKIEDKWVGIFMESLITCFERKPYLWTTILEVLNTDPIFREYQCKRLYVSYSTGKKNEYLRQFYNFFTKLSSGHKIVMLSLTKIIEYIDEKVLIVVDEPELYLHPPLLSSYIRSLSILMKKRNGVAILATHSPIVLQELPNNCIYKLDRRGKELRASRLDSETFAQNISTLMTEVFGLESEKSGFVNIIDNYVNTHNEHYISLENAYKHFDNQLGSLGMRLLTTKLYNESRIK
ncbi:AAA family ATPase [Streptococcus salivarius]